MVTIPNQASLPMAWKMFTDEGDDDMWGRPSRLLAGGNRDRLVDCMEEFVRFTLIMRPHMETLGDRYSERTERKLKAEKARIKAEGEAAKAALEESQGKTSIDVITKGVNGP